MRILTINAEDLYNGYISPQDRDWGDLSIGWRNGSSLCSMSSTGGR